MNIVMLLNEIIATTIDEVGISWFDFYSIGHICMGIGIFLFFSFFYVIPKHHGTSDKPWLQLSVVWIITVGCGIAWEFFENIVLFDMGSKFEGRIDSMPNVITDVLFVAIGGLISWAFAHHIVNKHKNPWGYYIFGIVAFGLWIGMFIVLRYLTFKNTPVFS